MPTVADYQMTVNKRLVAPIRGVGAVTAIDLLRFGFNPFHR